MVDTPRPIFVYSYESSGFLFEINRNEDWNGITVNVFDLSDMSSNLLEFTYVNSTILEKAIPISEGFLLIGETESTNFPFINVIPQEFKGEKQNFVLSISDTLDVN